jgi:hypothetical protein
MNKKFFTLMAGVFLLAGLVGTAQAQNMGAGTPVTSFGNTADTKLYQIRVKKGVDKATAATADSFLLIMKSSGLLEAAPYTNYYKDTVAGTPVARTIGESLWCATTNPDFTGSLGVNFSFTNKSTGKLFRLSDDMGTNVNVDLGFFDSWGFSGQLPTIQENFPLYSYIDKSNVIILLRSDSLGLYVGKLTWNDFMKGVFTGFTGITITVPAAGFTLPASENHVDNILWSTLTKPAGLVLKADDYNTRLGTVKKDYQQITFNKNNSGVSQKNPWTDFAIQAVDASVLADTTGGKKGITPVLNGIDEFVAFKDKQGQYLRVDTSYSTNGAVTQYLTFKFGPTNPFKSSAKDSVIEGQYFFRLYYNIYDDQLFIDAYQITHRLPNTLASTAWYQVPAMNTTNSPDGLVRNGKYNYDGAATDLYTPAGLISTNNKWNHVLRVSLVDIDTQAGSQLVTLGNVGYAPVYGKLGLAGCGAAVESDYESIDAGLYTIKNAAGQAFGVPINTDSLGDYNKSKHPAAFYNLDGIYDPIYTPSSQWVVQKIRTDANASATSPIRIINREFPNIVFNNIQLRKGKDSNDAFDGLAFQKSFFTKVPAAQAKDKHLGYLWIDQRTAESGGYAFQYYHSFSQSNYLGVENGTSRVRIAEIPNQFRLVPLAPAGSSDYDGVEYGYRPTTAESAKFVQLKRLAYEIKNGTDVLHIDPAQRTYKAVANNSDNIGDKINGLSDYGVFLIKSYHYVNGKEYHALLDTNSFYGRKVGYDIASPTAASFSPDSIGYIYNYAGISDYKAAAMPLELSYTKLSIADGSVVAYANVQGESRTSAFHIGVYNAPLYRRFDGGTYTYGDADKTTEEKFKGDSADANSPLWLKFHDMILKDMYLFENSNKNNAFRSGLKNGFSGSFLGIQDQIHYTEGVEDTVKNLRGAYYQFYVDTAYVKRTADGKAGPSVKPAEYTPMPQYMLAVRPIVMPEGKIWVREGTDAVEGLTPPVGEQDPTWGQWKSFDVKRLTRGYYVFNAQDSIYKNNLNYQGKKEDNITGDVRLAFVDGVHYGDTFYVIPTDKYPYDEATTSRLQRNPELLHALPWYRQHYLGENTHYEPRWYAESGKYDAPETPNNGGLNAAKDSYTKSSSVDAKNALNGKSMVFQFRLRNLGQTGGNPERNFFIETQKAIGENYEIAPDNALFINNHNGAPVVSGKVKFLNNDAINDAALGINVVKADEANYGKSQATANETVVIDGAKIISGVNSVTILNAAGKTVTVTNVLGQAVAKTVVSSDNASISLPKGIVIVSVDGKSAKALVK